VIVYCQTGGIGDAIMGTAVVAALERRYRDEVKIVHFEDLVQQVVARSERFPLAQLNDLAVVGDFYPDAQLAVINKFRKDNDGELSFFYALDRSMLGHVRLLRSAHMRGILDILYTSRTVESLYDFDSLRLLMMMNMETNYFADWRRYGFDVGFEDVHLDHPVYGIPAATALGDFAVVHDSRLPGSSGASSYPMKAWYTSRWSRLCTRLAEVMPVVQIVGADQPVFKDAVPHTEIIGTDAVFADYLLLRQSRVYVGTDSWPAHAAICINGPKFVVLKGAVSRRWDHDGRYSRIIRVGDCQACEGPRGANSGCLWRGGSHQCMDSITVEMVFNAVMEEIAWQK